MTTALTTTDAAGVTIADAEPLVASWLASKSAQTVRAYAGDLEAYAAHCGQDRGRAVAGLLSAGAGPANAAVLAWRNAMSGAGLAPATVNRRLAALRSVVKLARVLGHVAWRIEIPNVRSQAYRDTRGPGVDAAGRLVRRAGARDDAKGRRDLAMIRLMLDCGLRVGEVVGLDLEHAEDTAVWILGKGRTERERIGLPVQTAGAIRRWLEVRGDVAGPLFQGVTRHGKVRAGRLSTRSVRRMLEEHGEALGTAIRPHGLRHTAITAALDATNGDLRKCARFSRHANLATLERYDDNRRDVAADVAADLAGSW